MEEKHVVSVIRFILLWVSCVGEPPVPASKEWLETHQGEAAGSLGVRLQLWAWGGAPEEALLCSTHLMGSFVGLAEQTGQS